MYQGTGVTNVATGSTGAQAVKTAQRVRVKHNKVRSGCLTCKIRRKKCDEGRPLCARCVKAGVKCDGYLRGNPIKVGIVSADGGRSILLPDVEYWPRTVVVDVSGLQTAALRDDGCWETVDPRQEDLAQAAYADGEAKPYENFNDPRSINEGNERIKQHEDERSEHIHHNGIRLGLPRIPNTRAELPQISDLEGHCLSYFRHRTVPSLATYFECCIWRDDIVQDTVEMAHPALFYATIALGAVHRRFSMGITPEAFEYCAHSMRLYKRAVRALEQLKHSAKLKSVPTDRRVQSDLQSVIAACEVMLGIFQEFQGERHASAAHVMSGVRHIIASPLRFLNSEAMSCSGPAKPRVACQIMYRLYCRATQLLGTPVRLLGNQRLGIRASALQPEIPEVFTSLEEMRDHLFTIVDNLWNRWPRGYKEFDVAWDQLQGYEVNLRAWAAACAKTAEDPELTREPWQKKTFNLLHLTRSVAYLILCSSIGLGDRLNVAPIASTPTFRVGDASDDLEDAARWMGDAVERLRQEGPETGLVQVRRIVEEILEKHQIFRFEDGKLPDGPDPFAGRYEGPRDKIIQTPDGVSAMEMVGLFSIAKTISEMEENAAIQIIKGVVPPSADFRYVDIACIFVDTRKLVVRYFAPRPEGEGLVWVRESWSF